MQKPLLIAVGLTLLLAGMAVAGPPEPGTTPATPQPSPSLLARTMPGPCPIAWRLVPGSQTQGGGYLCEVNLPAQPGNCPPNHKWVSKCQGGKSVLGCKPVGN
jgi:hypothetical protein